MSATRIRAGHHRGWRARLRARLFVQSLENRVTPAQFVVTSSADSGAGSLRAVISVSNTNGQADTITFNPAVTTINLTTGQLTISEKHNLTINGGGAVTINGAPIASAANRIFTMSAGSTTTIALKNITLSKGNVLGRGGAIANLSTALLLTNVLLLGNSAVSTAFEGGGAIYGLGGTISMDSCRLDGNSVNGGGWGGGVYLTQGKLNVNASVFSNNIAMQGFGGALEVNFSSTATITNSTMVGNQGGGAIDVYSSSSATITNCTVVENANVGIVVQNSGSQPPTVSIRNCTIANNAALYGSAGVNVVSGIVQLDSTVVASNSVTNSFPAPIDADINLTLSSTKGSNNLIGVSSGKMTGTNNQIGNLTSPLIPGLLPLANYGGPTQTRALLPNSPCINAGSVIAGVTTDQRGYLRTYSSAPDIGAYEAQPPRVAAIVINDGSVQRSRVTSVTVNFDSPVAVNANAFRVQRQSDGQFVDLLAQVSVGTPTTSVLLTFSGALTEFSSLKDGRYTLTALGNQVTNFVGNLDGNADGMPGDDYVLVGTPSNGLFRLFGDSDGDGYVGTSDLIAFRLALGGTGITFDFNNNGSVDASDFIQFRLCFGESI